MSHRPWKEGENIMNGPVHERQEAVINTRRKRLMRKMLILGSMVLSLLILAPYGFADEGGKLRTSTTHMKVNGVVSKVQSGLTTVKTSWGSLTIASTVTPKNLAVGEEVDMQVSENNAVIDIHRKEDRAHSHRYVSGNLTYASADKKEIKLWTPEGEKTFDVQTGRSKMSSLEEGGTRDDRTE